jgi:uncharacterized protein (TIGR03435 family)
MNRFLTVCLAAFAVDVASAQTGNRPPVTFEEASVKLSADEHRQRGETGIPPPISGSSQGIVIYEHVTLGGVLARAYGVFPGEIEGPSWLGERFYDIVAKVPRGAPPGQVPAMLQSLLADRFRMHVHWDTQQKRGYRLLVGKNTLRLTEPFLTPTVSSGPTSPFLPAEVRLT